MFGDSLWRFIGMKGSTHSDQHALALDTNDAANPNTLWVGNDGGLFRFNTVSDTWTATTGTVPAGGNTDNGRNFVINSTQAFSVGPHPNIDTTALAGFQHNGPQLDTARPP